MLETLKAAYDRPNALTQNKHYFLLNREKMAAYRWDLYPLVTEYYHEFNPFYVHTIPAESGNLFPEFRVFTVRDGYIGFADFLLKYAKDIPKWKTHFLVPESYATLIPENIIDKFYGYSTSQILNPDINSVKKVVVFTLLMDYYFGSYEEVAKKLAPLKTLDPDIEIQVCLSQRRNPFLTTDNENHHFIHLPELVRDAVGNRKINWIKLLDVSERSIWKDTYLLDLLHGQTLTCDSYLNFYVLGRGGVVNSIPQWNKKESLFDIDLSFGQKLHVHHLPKVKSRYADLLYFSKTNRGELWNHAAFHSVVKSIIEKDSP